MLFRAAALTVFTLSPGIASNLVGQASIIDGDTLEIHGTRIRLWGIDAPESSQLCRGEDSLPYRCGAKAANELDVFIAGRSVSCEPVSRDVYGRTVATCSVGGIDLAEWLVRAGLALDWPRYSKGKYDRRNAKLIRPREEGGRAAALCRGCIGLHPQKSLNGSTGSLTQAGKSGTGRHIVSDFWFFTRRVRYERRGSVEGR